MTGRLLLGLCEHCLQVRSVPCFSYPVEPPVCGCSSPLGPKLKEERVLGTGVLVFDRDVASAYVAFMKECEEDDVRDTILRLQSFVALLGSSYAEGNGKLFLSALISVGALAKVLSTTVDEEEDEPTEASENEARGY